MSKPLLFESGRYWLTGARLTGASHAVNHKPCQDAFQARIVRCRGAPVGVAMVVADGHGSERHDRSGTGSRLAAGCAVDLLRRVWAGAKSHASFVSQFKDEYPRLLVRRWRDAVLRDNSQRESVNDAVAASGTSEAQNQATLERYGTTIIVGLVTADFCMVGQIGDGDALLLQEKGPLTLIEPDASMYGTTTRSLCGPTPDRHWRVRRAPSDKSSVLMLSTDGLSDSFASRAGFLAFGTDLHHLLTQYGQRAIVRQIPVWLDGYSRDGSGDDITVGLASASSFSATPQFGESVP